MHSGLQIKSSVVSRSVRHTSNSDAQVPKHGIAAIIVVVAHQLAHVAGPILPYPLADARQILADWRRRVAAIVAAVLEWASSPKVVAVQAELLMTWFAEWQRCESTIADGIGCLDDCTEIAGRYSGPQALRGAEIHEEIEQGRTEKQKEHIDLYCAPARTVVDET